MAKFIIKESSIEDKVNDRILGFIKAELVKFIPNLKFGGAPQQGNFAYCESSEFKDEDFGFNMDSDGLKRFVDNTLNFRYENFTVVYLK
jgi:hypothetical protein